MEKGRVNEVEYCADLLRQDELVAIPTETVYGLAGNAFSETAIDLIYQTKNRPPINPLIVHIKDKSVLTDIAINIPEQALALADKYWPGPLTLILEKKSHISYSITAGKNTVGVRVPNHLLTLELLNSLDFPLVAPSANRSNHISPTHPDHVRNSLGKKAPYILDGGVCSSGIESTIVGFNKDRVVLYRHGAIAKEELESFLNVSLLEFKGKNDLEVKSPGMFSKHYSPTTKTILTRDIMGKLKEHGSEKIGVICFQNTSHHSFERILSPSGSLPEAAMNLYATLHEVDVLGFDLILVEEVPQHGLGIAINDRLKRASFHKNG